MTESGVDASRPDEIRCCPVCDGPVLVRKCKLVCDRCGALVENCSGD